MDESDLDENISSDDDEWDEWNRATDTEVLGTIHDETLVENDEEGGDGILEGDADDISSSDDDLPLIHLIPKGKKRKWKRTNFEPQLEKYVPCIEDPLLPENIPQPIHYFSEYIDDYFFQSMALYTNMKEVNKTGRSLDTTKEELKTFFACCMLIGIYNLPRIRMFWRSDTRVPIVSDNISRNRFFALRTRLKLVDDDSVSKEAREIDRFWKVRPMLDQIQKGCLQNERTPNVSIDEQMIPFHGKVLMRQFVRGKPNPVGLKNFVMTSPTGIPLDFHMYEGKGRSTESSLVHTPEKLDVGGRVVLKLTDSLPIGVSIFVDRYFTSERLIDTLLSRKIHVTGTLMKMRIPKTNLQFFTDKDLKKSGRGSHDMLVTEDNKMAVVKWFDSKPIHLASSEFGTEPVGQCKRWSVQDKKYIEINRPSVVKNYNEKMGGVDLLDRVMAKYPMSSRTNKWTIRCIYAFIDFSAAASWLKYKEQCLAAKVPKKSIKDYLAFKFSLAKSLLYFREKSSSTSEESDVDNEPSRKRRKITPIPDKRLRKRESKHLPEYVSGIQKSRSKCRYHGCRSLTFCKCVACNVFLCCSLQRNCFSAFHQ